MSKVNDNARKTLGQYPIPGPFEVDPDLDCPEYLDVLTTVPDSVMPKMPPKGHLKDATENFDQAAWGLSETRRRISQQAGTVKRKV